MPKRKSNLQIVHDDSQPANNNKKSGGCKLRIDDLVVLDPMTEMQSIFFQQYSKGSAFLLHGAAGTGKTYIALYKALEEVLDSGTPYEKVIICRSAVPSRDIGHLPGDQAEKTEVYMQPYISIIEDLFPGKQNAFGRLQEAKNLQWMITSFVRGITLDNAIVLVDECQNMNDMELNSIMTRIGTNSKVLFCGDFRQSDLYKNRNDMSGLQKFMVIAEMMKSFNILEFGIDDIVRSDIVKEYLMARMQWEDQYA